jgi:hypothetical protein
VVEVRQRSLGPPRVREGTVGEGGAAGEATGSRRIESRKSRARSRSPHTGAAYPLPTRVGRRRCSRGCCGFSGSSGTSERGSNSPNGSHQWLPLRRSAPSRSGVGVRCRRRANHTQACYWRPRAHRLVRILQHLPRRSPASPGVRSFAGGAGGRSGCVSYTSAPVARPHSVARRTSLPWAAGEKPRTLRSKSKRFSHFARDGPDHL